MPEVTGEQADGLSGIIKYQDPAPSAMASNVPNAVRNGVVDLGMLMETSPAYISMTARLSFPAIEELNLQGALFPGLDSWKLSLVSPTPGEATEWSWNLTTGPVSKTYAPWLKCR